MPCDQVIVTEVDLRCADRAILERALCAIPGVSGVLLRDGEITASFLGSSIRIDTAGSLTVRATGWRKSAPEIANEINRAYSREVVKTAASRFGFLVSEVSPGKLQMTRRTFAVLLSVAGAALALATPASAHHVETAQAVATTFNVGWPILAACVGAIVAALRSALRRGREE